jgi:hypothetical protein
VGAAFHQSGLRLRLSQRSGTPLHTASATALHRSLIKPTLFRLVISIRIILAMHIKDHYGPHRPLSAVCIKPLSLCNLANPGCPNDICGAGVGERPQKVTAIFLPIISTRRTALNDSDNENTAPILGCNVPNTLVHRDRGGCTAQLQTPMLLPHPP